MAEFGAVAAGKDDKPFVAGGEHDTEELTAVFASNSFAVNKQVLQSHS